MLNSLLYKRMKNDVRPAQHGGPGEKEIPAYPVHIAGLTFKKLGDLYQSVKGRPNKKRTLIGRPTG
jgi:hypothetical protein